MKPNSDTAQIIAILCFIQSNQMPDREWAYAAWSVIGCAWIIISIFRHRNEP
jgi:hypothetical protein